MVQPFRANNLSARLICGGVYRRDPPAPSLFAVMVSVEWLHSLSFIQGGPPLVQVDPLTVDLGDAQLLSSYFDERFTRWVAID